MNREEALTAMKADIELADKGRPGWSDEITFTHNGQNYTPNQLIKEAEAGTEAGLAFIDTIYIPNAEYALNDIDALITALFLDSEPGTDQDGDEEQKN